MLLYACAWAQFRTLSILAGVLQVGSMTQVVFLVDIGAFRSKNQRCENGGEKLTNLRRVILRILCYLSNHHAKRPEYLRWGYKLFNSQASLLQVMEKYALRDFNLETFEEFESDVVQKYMRFEETLQCLERNQCQNDTVSASQTTLSQDVLKEVLSQLFCDYAWDVPDMSSPDKHCKKIGKQLNFVFIVSHLLMFEDSGSGCHVKNVIPPKLLNYLAELIHLYWLDADSQQAERNSEILDPSALIKFIPLSLLTDKNLQTRLPVSAIFNRLFTVQGSLSKPIFVTLTKNEVDLCTLSIHPLRRKCLYTSQPQLNITKVKASDERNKSMILSDEWKLLFPRCSNLEIVGVMESTHSVLSSLEAGAFSCSSNSEYFHHLLKSLLARSSQLVVACIGPESEWSQFCVLCPINERIGSLTILRQDSQIHHWCQLTAKTSFSSDPEVVDEKKLQIGECEKNVCTADGIKSPTSNISFLDVSVLEKWAISQAKHYDDSLLNVITASNCSDTRPTDLLKSLHRVYRPKYPNLSRAECSSNVRTQKSVSAQEFQISKKSPKLRRCRSATLNVSQRSSRLVEESLQPRDSRERSVRSSRRRTICDVPKQIFQISRGYNDEETLFKYLNELYDAAVNGSGCLVTCSQTIFNVLAHHASIAKVTVQELAEKHFLLSAKKINEKHENDQLGKDKRLREYQIQTLMLLELESSILNDASNSAEKVVVLLRTMSFVAGAQELNKFLYEVVKENYGKTLRSFLEEVSDELSIPLFPHDSAEENEDNDSNLFSVASSISSTSMSSNISTQEITQRKRSILAKHPSFAVEAQKRQIHVPKRLLPKRKTKQLKVRVSAKKSSTKKKLQSKVKREMGKVCRNLFKKDQPKTPPHYSSPKRNPNKQLFVPETPSEKQGKARIKSATTPFKGYPTFVEDSPCKVILHRIDERYPSDQKTPLKMSQFISNTPCTTPKTPRQSKCAKKSSECERTTPVSTRLKGKASPMAITPSKRDQNVNCTTPKSEKLLILKGHNATPKVRSQGANESMAVNIHSSRRLFSSPKDRTPKHERFSERAESPKVTPSRFSPRLARKSEPRRPPKLSFSPVKFTNSENVISNAGDDTNGFEASHLTPPTKRVYRDKGNRNCGISAAEKTYVTPSALSLLHLTTSPVLDIPTGKSSSMH